jgi:hypothetical protein
VYSRARGVVGYVLSHHPKSFDWHARGATPQFWKHASPSVFNTACQYLNEIISIGTYLIKGGYSDSDRSWSTLALMFDRIKANLIMEFAVSF